MTTLWINNAYDWSEAKCDNCSVTHDILALEPIKDVEQRLDCGSEIPAGECPECGALCYVVKPLCVVCGETHIGQVDFTSCPVHVIESLGEKL